MAKKRVKSNKPAIIPIADWEELDTFLREIGNLQIANDKDEASATLRIDKIKAALAGNVALRKTRIDQIRRSLEAFAANRLEEFKGKRTRKLAFGLIGWRKSTKISISKDSTLDLIKQIFSKAKSKTFITIKETVSKDALAKLTDEQLASVGAKRKTTDGFFAEPTTEQAADYQ